MKKGLFILIFMVGLLVLSGCIQLPDDESIPDNDTEEDVTIINQSNVTLLPNSNYVPKPKCIDPNIDDVECEMFALGDVSDSTSWSILFGIPSTWSACSTDISFVKENNERDAIITLNHGTENKLAKINVAPGSSKTVKIDNIYYCFRVCNTSYGYEFDERWVKLKIQRGHCSTDCSTKCDQYDIGSDIIIDNNVLNLWDIGYGLGYDINPQYVIIEDSSFIKYPIYIGSNKTIYVNTEPYCFQVCDAAYGTDLFEKWAEIKVTKRKCDSEQVDECHYYNIGDKIVCDNNVCASLLNVQTSYYNYGDVNINIEQKGYNATEINISQRNTKTVYLSGNPYCFSVCESIIGYEHYGIGAKINFINGECPE